jgi:hypothetical protein
MIRFILNFFLFGFLFFLIWMFFPEAFETLVSWASHVYEFFKMVALRLQELVHSGLKSSSTQSMI